MPEADGRHQFEREVFPAEVEEVRRRRANAGDTRPLPERVTAPSTRLDLTGLAFSGGGIRSASFSIGVVQHLIAKGVFQKADYLSTVSGGGYAGACLSALMHGASRGERLLVEREGDGEPPALNHVRNCSNYLLVQGLLNRLQIPALFIAGLFHSLLMMLPPIVLLVLLTELFFEVTSYFLDRGAPLAGDPRRRPAAAGADPASATGRPRQLGGARPRRPPAWRMAAARHRLAAGRSRPEVAR